MATKITRPTLAAVPQSKTDCAAAIRQLGEVQRQFERDRADMNDQIATITQAFQPILAAQQERINALRDKGVVIGGTTYRYNFAQISAATGGICRRSHGHSTRRKKT